MKHSEAPFRLYKDPRSGKIKLWDETGEMGIHSSSVELDAPPPHWKLLRGFRSKESAETYLKGVNRRLV